MKYDNKSITLAGAELLSTDIGNKQATVIEQMVVSDKQPADLSDIAHLTLDNFADAIYYPVPIIHHQTNTFQPSGLITNNNITVTNANQSLLSNIEMVGNQQVGSLDKDYQIQMVGIVGHTDGQNDNTLVAVAVANQGEAFTIPASTDIPYQLFFDIAVGYSNASNVIVNVNNAGYINQADLINALQTYVTIDTDQVITGDKNFTGKLQHDGIDVADINNTVKDNHDGTINANGKDFGTNGILPPGNIDDATTPGFWHSQDVISKYAGTPDGVIGANGFMLIVSRNGDDVYQQFFTAGQQPQYRMKQWGNWTNWTDSASIDDVSKAYQNAVNTANNNTVKDNHDGTINANGKDFGTNGILPPGNIDDATTPGFWHSQDVISKYAGTPDGVIGANGFMLIVSRNGDDVYQQFFAAGQQPLYRMKQWGNWTNWNQSASVNDIPSVKEIDKNADLFAIQTAGTYISRWGFQDTLKNFPSADGSATIIYTASEGPSNGLKINVIDSWGNEYVSYWYNNQYSSWKRVNVMDLPVNVMSAGDSYDNYNGQYVHLDIINLNIGSDIGGNTGLPSKICWGDFTSIPNHSCTIQTINDNVGNSWRRIVGQPWTQTLPVNATATANINNNDANAQNRAQNNAISTPPSVPHPLETFNSVINRLYKRNADGSFSLRSDDGD